MAHLLQSAPTHSLLLNAQLQITAYRDIEQFFNILNSDIGSPVHKISMRTLNHITLAEHAAKVLHSSKTQTELVQTTEGDWYFMNISPYKHLAEAQKGVLISFTPKNRSLFHPEKHYKTYLQTLQLTTKLAFKISKEGLFLDYIPNQNIHNSIHTKLFIGKHITELLPKEIALHYQNNIKKAIDTGTVQHVSYQGQQKSTAYHYHTSFIPFEKTVIAMTQDVSIQKQSQTFVKALLHDVSQPLRTLGIFMKLLLKKDMPNPDKESQEFIQYIKTNIKSMNQLTKNLTDYLVNGKEPTFEVVSHSALLCEVIQNLQALISERKANIQFQKVPVKHIRMVRSEMRRLFQNLIENAIKFTPTHIRPFIVIEAKELDHCWQFSVTDNGRGIAVADIDKIFEPLVRKHLFDEQYGHGLGLAICRNIVHQHGGDIWAVAGKNGIGSTFYFTISKEIP